MRIIIYLLISIFYLLSAPLPPLFAQNDSGWGLNCSEIRKAYLACEEERFNDAMNILYEIEYNAKEQDRKRFINNDRVVYNLTKAMLSKSGDNIEDAFKYVNRANAAYQMQLQENKLSNDLLAKKIPQMIGHLINEWSGEFRAIVMPKIEEAYAKVKDCTVHHAVADYLDYFEACLGITTELEINLKEEVLRHHLGSTDLVIYYLSKSYTKKCMAEEFFIKSEMLWENTLQEANAYVIDARNEWAKIEGTDAEKILQDKGISAYSIDYLTKRIREQLDIANVENIPVDSLQKWEAQKQQVVSTRLEQEDNQEVDKLREVARIKRNILLELKRDSLREYKEVVVSTPKTVQNIFDEVVRVDDRINLPCTHIEAIPKGEYGQDIAINLTYGGCDSINVVGKDYAIGTYRSDGVDVLLMALGKTVLYAIGPWAANKMTGEITGFADGHPVKPTKLSYDGELGRIYRTHYFSVNSDMYKQSTEMGASAFILNNEELALLRAIYAKSVLIKETGTHPDNIELAAATSPEKGEDYRKVEIKLYIKDAHKKELDQLSDQLKEILRNKPMPATAHTILN